LNHSFWNICQARDVHWRVRRVSLRDITFCFCYRCFRDSYSLVPCGGRLGALGCIVCGRIVTIPRKLPLPSSPSSFIYQFSRGRPTSTYVSIHPHICHTPLCHYDSASLQNAHYYTAYPGRLPPCRILVSRDTLLYVPHVRSRCHALATSWSPPQNVHVFCTPHSRSGFPATQYVEQSAPFETSHH